VWYVHEGMGWWIVFSGIWMLLFCAGVVALVVWGIAKLTGRGSSESSSIRKRNPLDIAKERYARGEISKEQFEQIKKDLSQH
jgi:putative membrane protein